MEYPKISIVTPSFNQGEFIDDTICSIINQGYPNLEYIICDGGSTDNTVDIIKKYESQITYWCSEKDKGQTDAINKGMKRATGEIVGWINSDDVMLNNSLFEIAHNFMYNKKIEFINGLVLDIDRNGLVKKLTHPMLSKFFMKHGAYNICQQGMFWKKSVFNKIGGYLNDSFHGCMDRELLIRMYENNIIMKQVNKPIAAIRIYGETKTALGGEFWLRDTTKLKEMYGSKYPTNEHNLYNLYFLSYVVCKFFKLYYLSDWMFKIKYMNKLYKNIKL